jgi:hypothetical protein
VLHPRSATQAWHLLQLVHSDLMGPFNVESAVGNKYVLTAIDDFSRTAAVKPLKHKARVTPELVAILKAWERQSRHLLKAVRTDRGAEYDGLDKRCSEWQA